LKSYSYGDRVFYLIGRILLILYSSRINKIVNYFSRFILPKREKVYSVFNGLKMDIELGYALEKGTFLIMLNPHL
jgi:hypothetical protein